MHQFLRSRCAIVLQKVISKENSGWILPIDEGEQYER